MWRQGKRGSSYENPVDKGRRLMEISWHACTNIGTEGSSTKRLSMRQEALWFVATDSLNQ